MAAPRREEVILAPAQTEELLDRMARSLAQVILHPERRVVVGIRRGGAVVARRLRERLQHLLEADLPIGYLDITFYRDDLATVGPNPLVSSTELTVDLDGREVILVDDVLHTGRTIRAALNALFDYGRPQAVKLAVLVDRGHRQLPIQADVTGLVVESCPRESIKLLHDEATGVLQVVRRVF